MEKIVKQGLLYDFYGALLNEHQRDIYETYIYDNLSVSEIASDQGISRQGIHDLIRRCDKALEDYENKLHLVDKFLAIKEDISLIEKKAESEDIKKLAGKILEQL